MPMQTFDFLGNVIVQTQEIDAKNRGLVLDAGVMRLLERGSLDGRISRDNTTDSFGGLNQVDRLTIKYNEKLFLLKKLNNIKPAESYNNDLLVDSITIQASRLLNTKQATQAYRARKDNKKVAVVFTSVAPNGYNGSIRLLVGIKVNGQLAGVRVVKHQETPGLGDVVLKTE